MCGIAGYYGKKNLASSVIKKTLSLMINRGPDYNSYKKYQTGTNNVVLMHSRLSIIDLEERSNQPFVDDDLVIVFNGEIYNYLEIKSDLKKLGVKFKTKSDTEVLLKAYRHYGKEVFDKLEGMWSFCIFEKKTGRLVISRDRFGEKPLYFLNTPDGIYFASEIKFINAMLKKDLEVDHQAISRFIVLGHKSFYKKNVSFYKGIKSVGPHEVLKIFRNLNYKISTYWKAPYKIKEDKNLTRDQCVKDVREKLIRSLEIRMRSDVPISFCLSGGIDSGSLVSIASKVLGHKVNTFSIIDTDQRYNELKQIKSVIKDTNCENTIVNLSECRDYFELFSDLVKYRDAPIMTVSYFVHSLLLSEISKKGFKIAMSGVAADEMFTGYFDHFSFYLKDQIGKNLDAYNKSLLDWQAHISPLIRNPKIKNLDNFFNNNNFRDHIYLNSDKFNAFMRQDQDIKFSEFNFNKNELRNRMLNELFYEVVRVILNEDDSNSMYYSVENRSPFLDKDLFEYSLKIPTRHLIHEGYNKSILRQSMKGILNDKVRLFREKKGFNASITTFFDFKSNQMLDFLKKDSEIYDIINKEKFISILNADSYPNSYNKFIFRVLGSKIFLDTREN